MTPELEAEIERKNQQMTSNPLYERAVQPIKEIHGQEVRNARVGLRGFALTMANQ